MKTCTKCGIEKDVNHFSKCKSAKDGLQSYCKVCVKEINNKWREANPEKAKEGAKKWYEANQEKHKENSKKWKEANPKKTKENHLKRNFGITLEQYNEIFWKQKGSCAICGKHQNELNQTLAVDHDHATGKIRGLLCSNCNRAIGLLKDSPAISQEVNRYLNRSTRSQRLKEQHPDLFA